MIVYHRIDGKEIFGLLGGSFFLGKSSDDHSNFDPSYCIDYATKMAKRLVGRAISILSKKLSF